MEIRLGLEKDIIRRMRQLQEKVDADHCLNLFLASCIDRWEQEAELWEAEESSPSEDERILLATIDCANETADFFHTAEAETLFSSVGLNNIREGICQGKILMLDGEQWL